MTRHKQQALSAAPETAEGEALMAELRKHHPDVFGVDAHRRRARRKAKAVDKPCRSALGPLDESERRQGTLADFVSGTCALTLMPAAACSSAEREMYFTELLPLREALIEEFRVASPSDAMLVDTAVAALFDARRLNAKAASIIGDGLLANVRAAEIIDRMAARAHGRFLGAVEVLRRAQGFSFEVEAVERVGDRPVAVGDRAAT